LVVDGESKAGVEIGVSQTLPRMTERVIDIFRRNPALKVVFGMTVTENRREITEAANSLSPDDIDGIYRTIKIQVVNMDKAHWDPSHSLMMWGGLAAIDGYIFVRNSDNLQAPVSPHQSTDCNLSTNTSHAAVVSCLSHLEPPVQQR
jgi:hypothetical protein